MNPLRLSREHLPLVFLGFLYSIVTMLFSPILRGVEFVNTNGISIPISGNASPYPSSVVVSNVLNPVKVRLKLTGLTHPRPAHLDIFLVGPSNLYCKVMSDVGGTIGLTNVDLLFDDESANVIPTSGPITPGTYHIRDFSAGNAEVNPPEAIGSDRTNISSVAEETVNGVWKLFVIDDTLFPLDIPGTLRSWSLIVDSADIGPVPTKLAWSRAYDGPTQNRDLAAAVAVDERGDVIVTGFSMGDSANADFYTAKYAGTNGTLIWEQRYDGPANGDDFSEAVVVGSGGHVTVTGRSYNGTNDDIYTARYSATNGSLLWQRRYNGPANDNDSANTLALDKNGNVFVVGRSHNGTNYDSYVAKYANADGSILWERKSPSIGSGDSAALSIAIDSEGNAYVAGFAAATNSERRGYLARYAAAGGATMFRWDHDRYGEFQTVAVDKNDDAIIAGYRDTVYYIAKFRATGGFPSWQYIYWQTDGVVPPAVAVDPNGDVVFAGIIPANGGDYSTVKRSGVDGAQLWERTYDNGLLYNLDEVKAVAVDHQGNVIVSGTSIGNNANGTAGDFFTIKYSANGSTLWQTRFNGPKGAEHLSRRGLAIGTNGTVALCGRTGVGFTTVDPSWDWIVAVYRETAPSVSIEQVSDGIRLRFAGTAGTTYQVQYSSSVSGPWLTNATLTALS